ncbi:hypothetical protein [Pectobacterium aroidearum]|uniref:hypothetical protein n=1 Tax=Pectobacterium aroidearum TaxID=1201031 RepID=UPI0015DF1B07|nr:hypothetical protein [Pectobacterium aroidearum]MBA0206094.1 hypothetical protein [Pectobacterium aroidearum]
MIKKSNDISDDLSSQVNGALDRALNNALILFNEESEPEPNISLVLKDALTELSRLSQKASTGFTNIVTCLSIKAARNNVDIRYHQVQIQDKTERPAGFNFRGVSEKVVYPWLTSNTFEGAKSGWQTRTFERPKPYMMDYDENIGDIKVPFLTVFNEIECHCQSADEALSYLIYLQIKLRESKKIVLSVPRTEDILLIVSLFRKHFFYKYKTSKGASRLPVLALYAIYKVLITQMSRYDGMELKPLEEHSAADSQTGAVGDIEIINSSTNDVFEAIEVKHDIFIDEVIIQDVVRKVRDKNIDRYYVLTTSNKCEPDNEINRRINTIKQLYNCQVIANGVVPSIKYYLRLITDPTLVLPLYVELLEKDKAIKHEHREVWNKITTTDSI